MAILEHKRIADILDLVDWIVRLKLVLLFFTTLCGDDVDGSMA